MSIDRPHRSLPLVTSLLPGEQLCRAVSPLVAVLERFFFFFHVPVFPGKIKERINLRIHTTFRGVGLLSSAFLQVLSVCCDIPSILTHLGDADSLSLTCTVCCSRLSNGGYQAAIHAVPKRLLPFLTNVSLVCPNLHWIRHCGDETCSPSALIIQTESLCTSQLHNIMVGMNVNPYRAYIRERLQEGRKMNDAHVHKQKGLRH